MGQKCLEFQTECVRGADIEKHLDGFLLSSFEWLEYVLADYVKL